MRFPKASELDVFDEALLKELGKKYMPLLSPSFRKNLLLVFEAKDYKDRIHKVVALRTDEGIIYTANGFGIPKNIFKVLLCHDKNEWLYVNPDAEKLLYADLLIEVI